MSDRLSELTKLLEPISKTIGFNTRSVGTSFTAPSYALPSITQGATSNVVFSFAVALTIIFVLLIVIHYGITPIFSFSDGSSGSLPLANTTDGQLVWTKGPVAYDISANVTRILPYGFTIQQDIFVQNEPILSRRSRVFSYRSMTPVQPSTQGAENLINTYPNSNLLMYLSPSTNDLIVQAITTKQGDKLKEAAPTVLNIPIGEVFRLTVVFLPQLLEVYINGKLHSSTLLQYTPVDTTAYFFGPPDAYSQTVRVMNFKYWDRALSPGEIKNSTPAPPDKSLFNPDQLNGSTCS